jgi:hypothetical protein
LASGAARHILIARFLTSNINCATNDFPIVTGFLPNALHTTVLTVAIFRNKKNNPHICIKIGDTVDSPAYVATALCSSRSANSPSHSPKLFPSKTSPSILRPKLVPSFS